LTCFTVIPRPLTAADQHQVWLAGQQAGASAREVPTAAVAQGVPMPVSDVIAKIVSFLRAGYPQGIPATDTFAVLALLRRRLSDEEAVQIATQLIEHGDLTIQATDIRVMITKITDEMPSPDAVERVKKYLETRGWPINEEFPPVPDR
jgi:hypothetical protein